jgi:hypothetical protein
MNDFLSGALWALSPTVLVGVLFWLIMRAIVNADRAERAAYAVIEASERERFNAAAQLAKPRLGAPGADHS